MRNKFINDVFSSLSLALLQRHKRYLNTTIFFLSMVFSLSAYAQNTTIDSLKTDLNKDQEDSLKANTMYMLAYNYMYYSVDTALLYGKELGLLANKLNSDNYKFKANNSIATAYLYLNKYDSAQVYYDRAFEFAGSSIKNKSSIYTNKGLLFKRKGDYEQAIQSYLDGVKFDKKNGVYYGEFLKLMNIGNVYIILEDYYKAIEYNSLALALKDSIKEDRITLVYGSSLNNIATCYSYLEDYDKALLYFNKALAFNLKNENKKEITRNYLNIGSVYHLLNNPKPAIEYLSKAYVIAQELGVSERLHVDINLALGKNYNQTGQYTKSKFHFQKALALAKAMENLPLISEVYMAISEHYSSINNAGKAFDNYKYHITYRDSIFNLDKLKNIQDIESKYQTERKDKELAQQKLQIQKQKIEILEKKNNYKLSLFIGGVLLLTSLGLWFYYRQRQNLKNKEIIALQRQQEIIKLEALIDGEEKERNRIAQDLHDGINGDLSVIKYKITSIECANFNSKDTIIYTDAISLLDNAVEQIRRISHNLAPPSLYAFNLIEAIQQYCSKLNASNPVSITFQYFGNQLNLEKEKETAIYRIIQELLTNIIKHSKATEALVQINKHEKTLLLTIEDNGKGFDLNTKGNNGIGLQNIKSRVGFLNANMDINSSSEGTSFNIEMELLNSPT